MKFLSALGVFSSALALSMLVAFSAVAFPETRIGGTKGNDWGSPSYPNWNLPHDCGGHELRGALFGSTGAGDDRIWGKTAATSSLQARAMTSSTAARKWTRYTAAEVTTS